MQGAFGHRNPGCELRHAEAPCAGRTDGLEHGRGVRGVGGGRRSGHVGGLPGAPQRHDDVAAHRERDVGAEVRLHHGERKVDARRHPARRPDVPVDHHQPVTLELDGGFGVTQQLPTGPVGGGAPPCQQPAAGEHERAAAHRCDPVGSVEEVSDAPHRIVVGEQVDHRVRRRPGDQRRGTPGQRRGHGAIRAQFQPRRRDDPPTCAGEPQLVGTGPVGVGLREHIGRTGHVQRLHARVEERHHQTGGGRMRHVVVTPATSDDRIVAA